VLTMTLDQLQTRTGLVTTAHGGTLSVDTALEAAGQANVIPVVLDSTGIVAYGQSRRTATTGQRFALAARDKGCCFPGCDAPPGWTQVHHIVPWANGGGTDLDNECLLCGYHHREHDKRGWTVVMSDGQPYWIPPPHIDPAQTPIRNTMHDGLPELDDALVP
jgi:Zn ribbon nucleic-acid-binding protein